MDRERQLVKLVAKAGPWLAPMPSAFFVGRSSLVHLDLPLAVAVIAAVMIEVLGLATVHTALWLSDYNASRRKSDPRAPTWIAVVLAGGYLITTISLIVVLEVWPFLSVYAPALFPLLAIVGAWTLALIANQERREAAIKAQKAAISAERKARRVSKSLSKSPSKSVSKLDSEPVPAAVVLDVQANSNAEKIAVGDRIRGAQVSKSARKEAMLDALLGMYLDNPTVGATDVARALGVARSTVYNYQSELERAGRIKSNGDGVQVLDGRGDG
jgi:hypothetical protein